MAIKDILILSGAIIVGLFILGTQLQTWEFEFEPQNDEWSVKVRIKSFHVFTYVDTQIDNVKYVTYIGNTGPSGSSSIREPRFRWSGLVAMKSNEQYVQISRMLSFQADTLVEPYMASLLEGVNKREPFKSKLVLPFDWNPATGIGVALCGAGFLGFILLIIARLRNISN